MYTRLFAECVVAIPDLQNLMVDFNNIQAMKLKKELSRVGFVSMTVDQAAQFYNNGQEAIVRIPGCARVQEFRGGRGENVHLLDRQGSWQRGIFVLDQERARPRDDA